MSMSKRIGVAVISIIFLVALISAVPVDAKKPFSVYKWWSEVDMMSMTGHIWTGGPDGKKDGLHGTIYWDNFDAIYLGPAGDKVQKFWGEWGIDWDDGGHIVGTHDGSFTYAISQSTVNGRITVATAGEDYDWSYLEGRKMHSLGDVAFPWLKYFLQIN